LTLKDQVKQYIKSELTVYLIESLSKFADDPENASIIHYARTILSRFLRVALKENNERTDKWSNSCEKNLSCFLTNSQEDIQLNNTRSKKILEIDI